MNLFLAALNGLAAGIAVAAAALVISSAITSSECVSLGYPAYKVFVGLDGFTGYCVKRVNATDIVVPLKLAKQGAAK